MSVDIKFRNKEAIVKAAQALGATVVGEGNHRLYSSSHSGFAIKLPDWNYPIVIDESGKAFYDNYNGRWGRSEQLEELQDVYAILAVEAECDQLGWYHERMGSGELVVHHPFGGTIVVQKGGSLDASGFSGTSCQDATLRLEQAMGTRLGEALKPQINENQIENRIISE